MKRETFEEGLIKVQQEECPIITVTLSGDEIVLAVSCEGYGGVIRFPVRYEQFIRKAFEQGKNK